MKVCRICGVGLAGPAYHADAPAMSSMSTLIAVATDVFVCLACGHAQSPDLPDVQAFYDTEYRISLQSDDHDQLYEVRGGVAVFRTAHQAHLMAELAVPAGACVLDFGAAKAATLRAFHAARPDIQPYVFDVSNDYRSFWSGWVPAAQQASYALPDHWAGRFNLITAHFVLEHVADPVGILGDLARCLAPGGQLFFTVPDPVGNSGDLLVVDHLNHFTLPSLESALAAAGLQPVAISQTRFRGAHVVLACAVSSAPISDPAPVVARILADLAGWQHALAAIDRVARDGRSAIYGAGFYGTLIASRLTRPPACFLDRNPHLQGQDHLGIPVLPPEACPADIALVFAGLNPRLARAVLGEQAAWLPEAAQVVYPFEAGGPS